MALRGGLRDKGAGGDQSQSKDDDGKRGRQGEQDAGHAANDGAANALAQAHVGDDVTGRGGGHEADEIDEKKRAERGGGEPEGRGAEVEGDPGENGHQGEEDVAADRIGGYQTAVAKERPHLRPELRKERDLWAGERGQRRAAASVREPCGHGSGSCQSNDPDDEKAHPPIEPIGQHTGRDAAQKSA